MPLEVALHCPSNGTFLVFDIYNDGFILEQGAKVGMLLLAGSTPAIFPASTSMIRRSSSSRCPDVKQLAAVDRRLLRVRERR